MIQYVANAICPKCHRPPATRYDPVMVGLAHTLDADHPLENITCTKPGCGTRYVVAALCLQTATPEPLDKALEVAKPRKAA